MKGSVHVSSGLRSLCEDAARRILDKALDAVAARGRFTLVLSGGSSPKHLYELLATPEWRDRLDWSKVHLFWEDDRYVPPDDPRSNYRMVREALLDKIDIPEDNIHRMRTELPRPEQTAQVYEDEIRAVLPSEDTFPSFDFVVLGLGENGHTASLFPHRPALRERSKLVVADFVPEVDMHRVTMTAPLLNAARTVAFFVSGRSKADVVHQVIAGPHRPEDSPAQLIAPACGDLLWLMDAEAAAKLPSGVFTETRP